MVRPLYQFIVIDKRIYVSKQTNKNTIPNTWVVELKNDKVIYLTGGDDGEEYEKRDEEEA